ncbi:MAG TPA: formate dehydrogenase subunit gamma, partial [Desulfobulbus sp.]|nr:formate dehydrogenase subunit gamma [Desulfobulbus sp.]
MNIKKYFRVILPAGVLLIAAVAWAQNPQILLSPGPGPSTASFASINKVFTGDWQQYGQLFTTWQGGLFNRIFLLVLTIVPTVFLLHYIIIGAKSFSHAGAPVKFFGILTRLLHWLAALSFSLLAITGLMVVFGKFLGGGALIMSGRSVHLIAAIIFCLSAAGLFLIW